MSIIRKYHNHKLQTNPWQGEKSHTTITRRQEDELSKTTSSLLPIKMIAKLEWTYSKVQQNIEQLQTPTNGSYNKQQVNNNRTTALERTAA